MSPVRAVGDMDRGWRERAPADRINRASRAWGSKLDTNGTS